MISVLIPYKPQDDDEFRQRSFEWVCKRWQAIIPGVELCIGTCDVYPFNRSAAINDAFRQSTGETIIVCDADTFMAKSQVYEALRLIHSAEAPWVIPYSEYYNLTRITTMQILMHQPDYDPSDTAITEWVHRFPTGVSGVLVLPRALYIATRGFDERFIGWGYEDNAFQTCLDTMFGTHQRVLGKCLHLWHVVRPGEKFDAPWITVCEDLHERYAEATHHPDRMQALIEEKAWE